MFKAVESFKKIMGMESYDDYDVTEEEISAAKEKLTRDTKVTSDINTEKFTVQPTTSRTLDKNAISNLEKRYSIAGTSNLKLIVIEPKNFEESKTLVDNLKAKKPIIVNLEKLETEVAKKIFDFLSGATYALAGDVHKITSNIFIFAPSNVGVDESKDNTTPEKLENKSPWR